MVFIHNLNNMLYFYQNFTLSSFFAKRNHIMLYFYPYYDMCNHISKKRGTVKCNWVK